MLEQIYKCCECKKVVEGPSKLKSVGFFVCKDRARDYSYPEFRLELCVLCREKLGLVERVIRDNKIKTREIPTTQEKVYSLFLEILSTVESQIREENENV